MPGLQIAIEPGGLKRPIGNKRIVVGRAPDCDLVLGDETVSNHHAAFAVEGERVFVQDLGSKNGVTVDGAAVSGTAEVRVGARVALGTTTLIVEECPEDIIPYGVLVLEEVETGHGTVFRADRLRIADSPNAHLRVEGAAELVLIRVAENEVMRSVDDDLEPIEIDVPFEVAGRQFVIKRASIMRQATRELATPSGLSVEATLENGPGPRAVVREGAKSFTIIAENRATFLWILAKRVLDDRESGVREESCGWVPEAEVLTAVWGKAPGATSANLRVLVCRLRRDLREAGLDPWFLEHRAGHFRARVELVELV